MNFALVARLFFRRGFWDLWDSRGNFFMVMGLFRLIIFA